MIMTTKEAQEAWGLSQKCIRELCKYGFIPMAEKEVFWSIPDDAEKPPVTVNSFVVLMESILEFNQGGNPNVYRKGLPKEKIKDALYYLSGFGFVAGYNERLECPELLRKASLLGKAYHVISKYRGKNNLPDIEVKRGVELGGKHIKAYAGRTLSY